MADAKTTAPVLNLDELELPKPLAFEIQMTDVPPEREITPLTQEEQEILYAEATKVKNLIAQLKEREEEIKAQFRRGLEMGTTIVDKESRGKVTLGRNPIFNEARFSVNFPYDEEKQERQIVKRGNVEVVETVTVYPNRELYKITPDRPAAQRILGKDLYDLFFDQGEAKVTIR